MILLTSLTFPEDGCQGQGDRRHGSRYDLLCLIFPAKDMGVIIMANRVDNYDEAFAMVPVFEGVMAKIVGIAPAQ